MCLFWGEVFRKDKQKTREKDSSCCAAAVIGARGWGSRITDVRRRDWWHVQGSSLADGGGMNGGLD